MNKKRLSVSIFCALILLVSAFAFFGCKKGETTLATADLPGWATVEEKNALYAEWTNGYKSENPTLVVFHGENAEDDFSMNVPVSVYESAAYYDEKVNASTIGWRGHGLPVTEKGTYDLTSYWINAAKYNVLIIHAEKFFQESAEDMLTKLYSAYKSRFKDDEQSISCDFGVSFAAVLTVFVDETLGEKNVSGEEIRFVGYGTGANAALAVAYCMYRQREADDVRWNSYGSYPSRVTLCDPCITTDEWTFTSRLQGTENARSAAEIVAESVGYLAKESPVVVELVESAEVNGKNVRFAYANNAHAGETYEKILQNTVSLRLAESYSMQETYASYREKNRIAFDWYVYSVIGSDDAFTRERGEETYMIGYPHSYVEYLAGESYGTTNWDDNARRPILNDRTHTNDGDAERGGRYGLNFALGAWTPTAYMKGLVGVRFEQRTSKEQTGKDVHGNAIYAYENYVLPSFRSENAQVGYRPGSTMLTGRIYLDENGDGKINDGATSAITSRLYVTIERNDGTVLCDRTTVFTDKYGYYFIEVRDKTGEENVTFTTTENGGIVTGFSAEEGSLIVRFELYCPKEFTAKNAAARGLWYDKVGMNNFSTTNAVVDVSAMNVHSVIVTNALLKRV